MKKLLLAALALLSGLPALAQNAYPLFAPADGVLKGDSNTYITTPAAASDIYGLWSGTCNLDSYLRGDGTCSLIDLTNDVTGILPVANGGTGASSVGNMTDVDDTNVTLTLGGTPTGSLLKSTSLTMGWTGTLAASRGGLGLSTVTDDTVPIANGSVYVASAIPGCLDTSGNHLNYNSTTNTISCGTSSSVSPVTGANPTGVIGLTAVNGVSPNFIRSDGAPALSQGIAPTWTANHTFSLSGTTALGAQTATLSAARTVLGINETDQSANGRLWNIQANGGLFDIYASSDDGSVNRPVLEAARSTNAVSSVTFGNTTDNPTYTFSGTGLTTHGGRVSIVGDVGTNPVLNLQNTNAADGRTTIDFTNARTTTRQWSAGIDTSGGVTKSFSIRDVTGAVTPFTLDTLGTTGLDSGATAQALRINSSNANGPYMTFLRGGSATADVGTGKNCGGSFTSDGLCLAARTGNPVELSAGGRTTPDLTLTSGGSIQTRIATTLGVGGTASSAPLRLTAADTLGDNYIQFWSSDGSTDRGWVGNGGSADNDFGITNNSAGRSLLLQSNGGRVNVTGGQEVRLNQDSGFYSVYNTAGSTRSGYFQCTTAGGCFVANDSSGQALNLQTTGGGAITGNGVMRISQGGGASFDARGQTTGAGSVSYYQVTDSGGTRQGYFGDGGGGSNIEIQSDIGALNLLAATGATLGSPTGGALGANSLNTAGDIRINNVAVCRSDGTNCPGGISGSYVVKSGATDRSSTTTLASDPDLQFTAVSGGTYAIDFCLAFGGVTTGTQGFKFAFNLTSAGSQNGMWSGGSQVNAAGAAHSGIALGLGTGSTTGQIAYATISVGNGSNQVCGQGMVSQSGAVTYAIQWAQNSSNANATRLSQGSYIRFTRLN